MRNNLILSVLSLAVMTIGAAAQTTVTNNNNGTANTVPVYTGSATLGNSPIYVSGSNVGIGITGPNAPLQVQGAGGIAVSNSGSVAPSFYGSMYSATDPNSTTVDALYVTPSAPSSRLYFGNATSYFYSINFAHVANFENLPPMNLGAANEIMWGGASIGFKRSGNMLQLYAGANSGPSGFHFFTNIAQNAWTAPNEVFTITGPGNVGIGTTSPAYSLDVSGIIHTATAVVFPDGSQQTTAWTGTVCGGDYAESVDASEKHNLYAPGDVLVLTSDGKGDVEESSEPYSTMVAGIYATKPGVIGRRISLPKSADDVPMALIGIVPTKVSAENGSIRRGDLLVSSSTPGYAMKGTDRNRMLGAVVGKAMGSLESGKGVIEVLVTLQ